MNNSKPDDFRYRALFTSRVLRDIWKADGEETEDFAFDAYRRFRMKDWGDLSEEDKRLNDEALTTRSGTVLAVYPAPNGQKFYIELEFVNKPGKWDVATIMYADER